MVADVLLSLADMHNSPIFSFGSTGLVPSSSRSQSSIVIQTAECYSEMDAQRDVFESHRHHVFSVAYYMTGDEMEAESILQDTFTEAFRVDSRPSIEQLDGSLMMELHRRLTLAPVPPVSISTNGLCAANVRRTDLEEALWELPARERLCFLLRDVEGYAPERIARLLESPREGINRTLLSARLRLRSLLASRQRSAAA